MATNIDLLAGNAPRPDSRAEYRVSFPNRDHHEAEVAAVFNHLGSRALTLHMARSSPGRYAIHAFARNVYHVRARDGSGTPLAVARPDEHTWLIEQHDGTVVFEYTVFGDHADGTHNGIDSSHAHLQIPATFVYSPEHAHDRHTVRFDLPADEKWRIATALLPTDDPGTFTAPDLHTFMDSPVEISDHVRRDWDGYGLVVHHLGGEEEVDQLVPLLQRITAQQEAVFGELPAFAGGSYLFLLDVLPWVFDDAMEHRDCCVLTVPGMLKNSLAPVLGKASHELFHAWCMERLRPRSLEPFDYTRANASPELWFAEGFATYYGTLALIRAGLTGIEQYARILGTLLDTVINSPGRRYGSVVEMSLHAPFTDAAVFVDAPAQPNSHTPYEAWGACLALALDLTLRTEKETTLDHFMRRLWERLGRSETTFGNDDLEAVLGEVTRDPSFAHTFFQQSVYGTAMPDFQQLLDRAGLVFRATAPATPTLGVVWAGMQHGVLTIGSHTVAGSALYNAGIDRGDQLLEIDGIRIGSPGDLQSVVAGKAVGDVVAITYVKRGVVRTRSVMLTATAALEVVPYEAAGRTAEPGAQRLRSEWLGPR